MIRTFAAADIGSNTAHLLVASTDGELVMRVDNLNEWIGLGEIVARVGEIPKSEIDQLTLAMREFKRVAEARKAERLYVFATEGMRIARNHDVVLKKIAKETGVTVEIISAQREAQFSFRGVQLDTLNIGPRFLFEVGGGSAQIGLIEGDKLVETCSLPLGTGRIIAESGLMNPCPAAYVKAATRYVQRQLTKCNIPPATPGDDELAVISGGVGRGLWRALHPDGDKMLHTFELEYLKRVSADLPVDRLSSRFNVKQRRSGTLLPGSIVYLELMKHFGIERAMVSEFGVREGAILELASGGSLFESEL